MNPRVEFDLQILRNNIKNLKNETNNINFLFPVKCCTNEKVLNIINEENFGFDISNLNEYKIIQNFLNNQFISVSGPLSYQLDNIDYDNLHIVANNLSHYTNGKGLRINFNNNDKFEKSRFGIDYKILDSSIKKNIEYIHFHNSDHKNEEKCDSIFLELKEMITEFPNLKYINLGGHLEDLSFEDGIKYLKKIITIIPNKIKLYVELGDFLFKNVGKLYCKVIDIRNDNDMQIVTLNFSKMANQRWAYPTIKNNLNEEVNTIFYGCSCCETDIYLECNYKVLNVGDELEFNNISPYSYQWDTTFNGVSKMNYIFK